MKTYANIDQKDISFFSKGKRKKFKVLEKELPFIKMLNDKYNPICIKCWFVESVEMTKSPSK